MSTERHPRLAEHLASFGREPEQPQPKPQPQGASALGGPHPARPVSAPQRPGAEVDLSQFGLRQRE